LAPESQILLSVGIPTLAVLIGILSNAQRTDRLEKHVDAQLGSFRSEIHSLRSEMNARFDAVDARFEAAHQALLRVEGVMDARLKHLEDRE
jgi:hypothetical protein